MQFLHLNNGFSPLQKNLECFNANKIEPECIFTCRIKFDGKENDLEHKGHRYGFSPFLTNCKFEEGKKFLNVHNA